MIEHPRRKTEGSDGRKQRQSPSAPEPGNDGAVPSTRPAEPSTDRTSRVGRNRPRLPGRLVQWTVALVLIAAAASAALWLRNRPITVTVVRPEWRTITETIAASGIVGGYREVTVGSQAAGVVSDLRVVEGERVPQGSVIAIVQNRVAAAQVAQAEQALATARAQLGQQSAKPLLSEVAAARSRVAQARSTLDEQRAGLARARVAVPQADAAIAQAVAQVERAKRDLESARARRDLQQKTLSRYKSLFAQGYIPAQQLDQQAAAYKVAADDVDSAGSQVNYAQSAVTSTRAARTAAIEGVRVAQANIQASASAIATAEADLRTLESQPRLELVEVAREQVKNASEAVRVARAQARDTVATAPFDGIVTQLLAQPGASTATGIVRLVETHRPEIRCDIDENNLASLHNGLTAVVTSTAYPGKSSIGRITRIGAQVDSARGTTEVAVSYDPRIPWLRPGQTVDVNLIIHPNVRRMLIPLTAVRRGAAGNSVFVIVNGRAVSRAVTLGPPAGDRVPVLSGLTGSQRIIARAEKITAGMRVSYAGI